MLLRRAAAPIALLAAVVLAGCTAPEPDPEPSIAPTEEPLFASEEEALAAAEEAFALYQERLNGVLSRGGVYEGELDSIASEAVIESQDVGFAEYRENGYRLIGMTKFDSVTLQSLGSGEGPQSSMTVYLCRDVADTDVVGSDGGSVVRADRDTRIPYEVTFEVRADGDLIITRDDLWADDTHC